MSPPSSWSKADLRAAAKRIYDDFDKGNLLDQNAYYVDFKEILAAQDADLKQAIAAFCRTSRNRLTSPRPSSLACPTTTSS